MSKFIDKIKAELYTTEFRHTPRIVKFKTIFWISVIVIMVILSFILG